MRRALIDDDVVRLVRAAQRMARLAQDIGERAQKAPLAPCAEESTETERAATCPPAERLVAASREAIADCRRLPDFGAPVFFRNPVWLLMLELFTAERSGVSVSVKSASLTLGGAASTANRTILELERLELIRSVSDQTDARRRLLKLTPAADATLQAYLIQQIENREPSVRVSLKLSQSAGAPDQQSAAVSIHPLLDRPARGMETALQ